MRFWPFALLDKASVAQDRSLAWAAWVRMLRSPYLWIGFALLVIKTMPLVGMYKDKTAPDFLCIYYGAKLLGKANLYDRAPFVAAVSQDAEFQTLAPISDHFKEWAPAPPPLYPPSSFYVLKPLTWVGFKHATLLLLWALPFFVVLTVWGAGVVAALAIRKPQIAPLVGLVVLSTFMVIHTYNKVAYLGQINVQIAAGLLGSLALATSAPAASALLLVITILVKPSGWLLAVPLAWLWRKQPIGLLVAGASGLALFFLPGLQVWQAYLVSAKSGMVHYWVNEHAFKPGTPNYALRMMASVIEGTPARVKLFQLGMTGVYALAFLAVFASFVRNKTSVYAVAACAMMVSFVLGPISWVEHTVFMIPFLVLLGFTTQETYRQAGYSVETSFWQSWGVLFVAGLFSFSILNFPAGAAARFNVLAAYDWHTMAATGLIGQAVAAVRLFFRTKNKMPILA